MSATVTVSVSPIRPNADAVTVVVPKLIPFSLSTEEGVVAPAGINTFAVLRVAKVEFATLNVTKIPPAGAGCAEVTGYATDVPGETMTLAGRKMSRVMVTVTAAVVSGRFGSELAWMVAVPLDTPVTGTWTLVAPAGTLTVDGTVATPVLLELRLMVTPPNGACPDKVRVRFCDEVPFTVNIGGLKANVPVTCTVVLPGVNPAPEAVIRAGPKETPVTWGCVPGVVCPAGMTIDAGEIVATAVFPLCSVTVRSAGVGVERVMGKGAD